MAHNVPGGFEWGTGGHQWAGQVEDPRFLDPKHPLYVSTETEFRPDLGPGCYKRPPNPTGVKVSFGPTVQGHMCDRFEDGVGMQRTEVERNPAMGPQYYKTTKYDQWPFDGYKSERFAPTGLALPFPKGERFNSAEPDQPVLDLSPFKKSEEEFWSSSLPRISKAHRFTPRAKWLVPDPKQYVQKGDGFHVSQARSKSSMDKPATKMVYRDKRTRTRVRTPPGHLDEWMMEGARERDRFKGLGPYLGYKETLEHTATAMGNFAKCGIASQVARNDKTILGNSKDDSMTQPGENFDNIDQRFCEETWGRHVAWQRWKLQHPPGTTHGDACPIVAASKAEAKAKRKRKLDPSHGTVQSRWHGMLRESWDRDDDWSCRPRKYTVEEKTQDSKSSSKAGSEATTPLVVAVKTSSDAVIASLDI